MTWWPRRWFSGFLGCAVLAVGTLVYVLDRAPELTPFFAPINISDLLPPVFGALGQSLPTFAHAFALSVLTGLLVVDQRRHALAACLTTTLIYHSALRGIRIDELESDLEGDIDLRGFLGLSDEVRRGYRKIRVNFRVKTDEKNIEKLKALSKLSPVFDVTSHGTDVEVNIEKK